MRECIGSRFSSVVAPKRGRQGICRGCHDDSGVAGFFITFSLADLEIMIDHELVSGWFLLGTLLGRQTAGLPMGSPWGGALTRMCLIYCDISFYNSIHCSALRRLPERGRIAHFCILGVNVLILEARYVDDYHLLWKGPPALCSSLAAKIDCIICKRVFRRYPLPLTRDEGQKFVGIILTALDDGSVTTHPVIKNAPEYG